MGNIKYMVDKRTEIMSIILSLSQCNEYACEHFNLDIKDEYREKVEIFFKKYKNERCITLAKKIGGLDKGFNFDNPIRLAFELEKDLSYKGKLSEYLKNELEDKSLIKEFLLSIAQFARKTHFEEFYSSEDLYYSKKLEELHKIFDENNNLLEIMEKFFRIKINQDFCINIIPSLINSNHGFEIDGIFYANIGMPSDDFKTISKFNKGYQHIIIHEFLHSFVNPLTENFSTLYNFNELVEKSNKLAKIGYGNPFSIINDTIVRALTILIRSKLTKIDIDRFLKQEKILGFEHIEEVYSKILEYEKQELKWSDYFENVLKVFFKKEIQNEQNLD